MPEHDMPEYDMPHHDMPDHDMPDHDMPDLIRSDLVPNTLANLEDWLENTLQPPINIDQCHPAQDSQALDEITSSISVMPNVVEEPEHGRPSDKDINRFSTTMSLRQSSPSDFSSLSGFSSLPSLSRRIVLRRRRGTVSERNSVDDLPSNAMNWNRSGSSLHLFGHLSDAVSVVSSQKTDHSGVSWRPEIPAPTQENDGIGVSDTNADEQDDVCGVSVPGRQSTYSWTSSDDSLHLPMVNQQPEVFIAYCFLACILHGQGQEQEASTVASEAFKIYRALIKQKHEHALACLSVILIILFMHGQNLFAVDLLKNAYQAALYELPDESPIIMTISFMVQQASLTVKQCGFTPARLRAVYDDFKENQSLKHPYTLLAGYHLAWRLAMDGGDSLKEARHLLSELEGAAEQTFGKAHMQTIAILATQARVLHDLKYRNEAEELMSEAITRIKMGGYHAKHPYALEAKRRHSIFLYDVNKIPPAEKLCIEVALGRVEVLGPEHIFSKRSVEDVKRFLCTPGRENEFSEFAAKLAEATVNWGLPNSISRIVQFW